MLLISLFCFSKVGIAMVCRTIFFRMQMQTHTSPLIKHRRKLLRTYPDVFVGSEAVAWATKMLKSSSSDGNYSILIFIIEISYPLG